MTLQVGAPVQVKVSAGTFPGMIHTATPDQDGKQIVTYMQTTQSGNNADTKWVAAARDDSLSGTNTWRPLEFTATVTINTGD